MSVLNGPGEGTWSMFAMKVAEERDAAREALANSDACWRMEQEFLQRKLDEARAEAIAWKERADERNDECNSIQRHMNVTARERDEAREVREDLRKELAQWKVVATEVVGMFDPVIKSGTEVDWPHLKSVCVGAKEANKSLREVKDRARRAGQILIEEIGADGPTDVDAVAEHATVLIRELRGQVSDLQAAIADCWRARVALALQGAEVQAERDEARRELKEILAVIHRDGGHHTGEHGISKSVADAHATWAAVVRERDEARAELAKTSADFHDVWESRDKVIEERERARQACNAYWHDLTRIALLCAQTDDEYPLKAVERTVREFAQSRRDFVRVADALGLVSTDDTGRVGAIASVEDIVAQARHAARALSREQPVAEEER